MKRGTYLLRIAGLGLVVFALTLALTTGGAAQAADLFFSEYAEGSGYSKAVEIYNGTGATVDLSTYTIELYTNGSATVSKSMVLSGSLAAGDVFVIAHQSADTALTAVADQLDTPSNVINFNGDDAVVLKNGVVVVDAIGQTGFDPGSQWGSGNASTKDNTIRRKATVCAGETDASDAYDPTIEWDGYVNNTFDGFGSHAASCGAGDTAPTVSSTSPADSTTNVAVDASVTVNFSEDVTTNGSSFTISCGTSGAHTVVVSGGPQSYVLNPDADFSIAETCTVTVVAAQVADTDATDPPDNMDQDYVFSFTTVTPACGNPATLIHDIQGSGTSSPKVNETHTIEGIVVGDFQTGSNLRGFFIQEEDSDVDGDAMTSECIFVYDGSAPAVDVAVGDVVRLTGEVAEYGGLTELSNVSNVEICPVGGVASAVTVTMPVVSVDDWEWYEGMLINIPQTLYATGNYSWGRYGEVDLSVSDRLYNPTNVATPGAPADAVNDLNDRSRIQLEDGRTASNPDPVPYLGAGNTLRAGDTLPSLTGVLHYAYGFYEVHPTGAVNFTRANARSAAPTDVGGTLKVASFNVLNYFSTFDNSGPICGPSANMGCRGADNAAEFTRQRDKIISAITAMNADIIGLMEIENHATDAALQDLVNGLNDATAPGTYSYLATGPVGTDAIKVAYIYTPATVTPIGPYAVLDSSVDPTFIDTKNRSALAQTFKENASGETFTAVVNHLKSKGSDCDSLGDPDVGDQQGNCNLTRTSAAIAIANWLATDPTGSGDDDFLIIGDLNAYAMEDPIVALESAGYTNLIKSLLGAHAYSYVYFGEAGYLDHALANAPLTAQVTGVAEWHINGDEPSALNYNDYNQAILYQPDAYAASDHDPVIVGLQLTHLPATKDITDGEDRLPETSIFDVFVGDIFEYTIEMQNTYAMQASFQFTDLLLGYDLSYVVDSSSIGNDPFGSGNLDYTTLLSAGEMLAISFEVQVKNVPVGTLIENLATITVYDLGQNMLDVVEAFAPAARVVPEPTTLLLLGLGLAGLFTLIRGKRKKQHNL
ncbi:MAG: ExeM/NucH family extracellular endonuclease [bacterium]|nr:ExeM/NucH family extracellular endonuclease [bacterium]